jgi:ribosomal protein S26
MADVDRCVMCGQAIPEGIQICPICHQNAHKKPPSEKALRKVAKVIKDFCVGRTDSMKKPCEKCPIRDICFNQPYLWEVQP